MDLEWDVMNKKIVSALLLLCLICSAVFAQNALTDRYLKAASDQYANRNNAKAFEHINFVLKQYNDKTPPQNVVLLAQAIYADCLSEIKATNDKFRFTEFQANLKEFPYVADDNLSRELRIVTAQFIAQAEEAERQAREALANSESRNDSPAMKEILEATERAERNSAAAMRALYEDFTRAYDANQQNQREEQEAANNRLLNTVRESLEASSSETAAQSNKLLIILIVIAVLFIIAIIAVIISVNMSRKQQQMFAQTLRVVSELQRIPYEESGSLKLANMYAGMRNIEAAGEGTNRPRLQQFEQHEVNDELRAELRDLAAECEAKGQQIDKATGRKNNSKNVAELVFKIAQKMNLGEYTSMLYFCASMVYDIGFLAIDPTLLEKEKLTEEEKYQIRGHVKAGVEQIDFVPEKFRGVFIEAILMHHENLDGSGYPDGLQGDAIPPVARIIHVVESFIAQISKRNYRGIFDKETAIQELRSHPDRYDGAIIDALDTLI